MTTFQSIKPDWSKKRPATKKNRCPACGKPDYCYFDRYENYFCCNRPAVANSAPTGWDLIKEYGNRLEYARTDLTSERVTVAHLNQVDSQPEPEPSAPIELIHAVYSDLLAELTLTAFHRQQLIEQRQFSSVEIETLGVKSYRYEDKDRVIAALEVKYTDTQLLAVPGFYLKNGKLTTNASAGLLIPVKQNGKLAGVRVRPDKPKADGPKYYWLSSSKHGGPKSPAVAPVYNPLNRDRVPGLVGVTEGEFKAFTAAQRLGYPFISVPGVGNWQKTGTVEQALELAGATGTVIIFYDNEPNPNTALHRDNLANALASAGLSVKIAEWSGPKGIDDLLNTRGEFSEYVYIPGLEGLKPDKVFEEALISGIPLSLDKTVSLIRSARGTGKTRWLTREINRVQLRNGKVLEIGHLVSLLKEAARRHGLDFYQEFTKREHGGKDLTKSRSLAITLNSLIHLETDKMEPVDLLVIDEVEQVLRMLTEEPLKKIRQNVIEILKYLIANAKKIVGLDADLSPISFNFFSELVGSTDIEIIVNTHKPKTKEFVFHDINAALESAIFKDIENWKRIFIATNGRVTSEKLYKAIQEKYPDRRGWLINSDRNNDEKEHEKIERINEVIPEYDYIIASPSLSTGVSIDVTCIENVYLLAYNGVNTHYDLLQQAGRVRNPSSGQVHCWIDKRKIKTKITDKEKLKEHCIKNANETGIAISIDTATGYRTALYTEQLYLNLWAELTAAKNKSHADLRGNFLAEVQREGHKITMASMPNKETLKETRAVIRGAKDSIEEEYQEGILNARDITRAEYEELETKKDNTKLENEEKSEMRRYEVKTFYGEVNEDIVKLDNHGKARKKVIFSIAAKDPSFANERDIREFQPDSRSNNPDLLLPEYSHLTLKTDLVNQVLERAGLKTEQGEVNFETFTAKDLADNGFISWVTGNKEKIEQVFGFKVRSDFAKNPVQLVSHAINRLGWALDVIQRRTEETYIDKNGKKQSVRQRFYKINRQRVEVMELLCSLHHGAIEARESEKMVGVTALSDNIPPL